MKRPEVSEIVACYQGFEDLRDDRTMHGPQARALERLVARQRQIDERREYPINGTHSQQVDKIAEALTQGIGTEEIPVHPDVKERIPWATIETMGGPQRVARWLEMYKTGLELPDKTRYAKMSVSVLKAGQPLETVRERHKGFAIKALLEALIILLRSMFKARSPKRSDYE